MPEFDYVKAWFMYARPAVEAFNDHQMDAVKYLLPFVGELNQARDLNIPMSQEIRESLEFLTDQELAEMARGLYYYGHWKPGHTKSIFGNSKGELWKIANLCDQILREQIKGKFKTLYPCQIHEGTLRVTYSDKDNWIWEEFSLATKLNFSAFKRFNRNHPFGLDTLEINALKLKELLGDMWNTNYEYMASYPNSEIFEYPEYLKLMKELKHKENEEDKLRKLGEFRKRIEDAETEYLAYKWLIDRDIDCGNMIFYNHKDIFSFGWRKRLSEKEITELKEKLKGFPYKWEIQNREN